MILGNATSFDDLKVLVVLARNPVTAPVEAGLGKQLEAEVIVVYLVGEVLVALTIGTGSGRLNEERAILTNLEVRIVERIDIDGQSAGVLRQVGRASDGAETEA